MMKKHLLALAAASLCAGVWATGPQPAPAAPPSNTTTYGTMPQAAAPDASSQRSLSGGDESDALEQQLRTVNTRADYAKAIEAHGYRISAINADRPDYLEYEIVKGKRSYEVQLDFDKGAAKAKKVDVTNNLWRAETTKRMLADANYRQTAQIAADPQERYSDRRYLKSWTDEKTRLEHALPTNQSTSTYRSMIEQQGYKITAVNDRKPDYVEYEIVKGDNSYEVQIDLDPKTKLGKDVDVTSNLWEAKGTEQEKKLEKAESSAMPAQRP